MSYDPMSPYVGNRKKKPYVSGSERTKKALGRFISSASDYVSDAPKAVAGDVKKAASAFHYSVAKPIQRSVVEPINREVARSTWNDGGQIGRRQRARAESAAAVETTKRAKSRLKAAKSTGAGRVVPLFAGPGSSKRGPAKGFVGGIGGDNRPKGAPPAPKPTTRTKPATRTSPTKPVTSKAKPTKPDYSNPNYWKEAYSWSGKG